MASDTTPVAPSLFPTIGSIADQTDLLQERPTTPEHGQQEAEGNEEKAVEEIESLCMKCHEQGVTRMMLTSIPYFREVIVMSFRCEFCGATNNEVQSASAIRPEGTIYTAHILQRADLDRQIVRSPTCEIFLPDYELTLPPSLRGQLTTVEGLIRDVVTDLSMDQPLRRIQDPPTYDKIQTLVDKLQLILGDEEETETENGDDAPKVKAITSAAQKTHLPMPAFTLKLDDPAGNSWIEFIGSVSDPKWNMRSYHRTLQQNIALGLVAPPEGQEGADAAAAEEEEAVEKFDGENEEVYIFQGVCSSCGHPLDTLMKKVAIPYFKDILIMSTNCDRCGYRDNEVKSGSAISEQGKRIILKIEDREDLSRDILKSETAGMEIPEIDLVLQEGTLGGRFTTLEGILEQVYEELSEKALVGDSAQDSDRVAFEAFLGKLKEVKEAKQPFTLILDDPLANSYVQNLYAPDPDPNIVVELYDRTFEQNEHLGLNDIKVEGYEEEEKDGQKGEP